MKSERQAYFLLFLLMGLFLIFANSCKKESEVKTALETGAMIDIEGNIYTTVKIGNRWWMAEDLKATKYKDSTSITLVKENTIWKNDTTGAYCIYNNESEKGNGLLYNWYVVNNSHKIAPEGWHVSTDEEWKEMERYLGMSPADAEKVNWRGSREGEKLKKEGKDFWQSFSNVWATNESGFSALAGGCRMFYGDWSNPSGKKSMGFWWSANEHGDDAWYRHLDYKNADIFRYYGPKNYGFSIRCVKD